MLHFPTSNTKKRMLRLLLFSLALILPLTFLLLYIKPTNTSSYHAKLLEQMEDAKTFEEFTNALFCYEVTSDSITTAYTIKNRNHWNIPNLEPTLSSFSYKDYLAESKSDTPNETSQFITTCLAKYDKADLTAEEKQTYTLLKNYLDSANEFSQYPFYEELLGSTSGVQANLPVTLGEYPLQTRRDVETYLQLLTQIPSYFEDIIAYEQKRDALKYDTPSFVTAQAFDSIQSLISGLQENDNCFVETFNQRIADISSLTKKQKQQYQKQNQAHIKKYVIPAYEKIENYLEKKMLSNTENKDNLYKIDTNTAYGICTLPKGKAYYAQLAQHNTGSNRSIEELISMTDQALSNALSTVLNVALTDTETYYYYCEHPLETYYQTPEAILDSLSLMIRDSYPLLSKTPSYEIKTVSDSLAPSLSPAFYMIPAIDDYENNTIYINPLFTNEENGNLFPTLAHEGFPGHLYQTVYFNESNPSDIRQILDYLGYVEGWATYVEMDSLSFLKYPLEGTTLCKLYQTDTIINLALCTRIDMGVNYEAWTLNDTKAFFEEQGFNSYYAEDIYSYVVESPASYLSYFIGYLEIMDIKDAYQRMEMENYSEKDFHQKLLDVGPADFETVRKYVLK